MQWLVSLYLIEFWKSTIWVHLTSINNKLYCTNLLLIHLQYLKLVEMFLKICSAPSNGSLKIKILIISSTPISIIFWNSIILYNCWTNFVKHLCEHKWHSFGYFWEEPQRLWGFCQKIVLYNSMRGLGFPAQKIHPKSSTLLHFYYSLASLVRHNHITKPKMSSD